MPEIHTIDTNEEVRQIMVEMARTQLAAVTAALKFWGGWVESANRYTEKLASDLKQVTEKTEDSEKFIGSFLDSSREYLREMLLLPKVAADHFTGEVEKISSRSRKPASTNARKARAKE